MTRLKHLRYALIFGAVVATTLSGLSGQVFAASSKWFETEGARIRLISLPSPDPNKLDAALQIELEPGWKTYWRSPGASGLPPQLNFAGSKNVVSTQMDFPVPDTFGEGKNLTAGYKKSVAFPIAVETLFANKPVTLNLSGIVGICSDICVPVPFKVALTEDGKGGSSRDVATVLFQSRLNLVEPEQNDFKIQSAKLKDATLHVEAVVPSGTSKAALMVEGPSDWYLTPTQSLSVKDGSAKFEIDLSDIPKEAAPLETKLKLTLVSNGKGVEREIVPVGE